MEYSPAKSFKDLIVWQKAHQLVLAVYQLSQNFPKDELYGLTSQLRRSASSVAANIAEAFKKKSKLDKLRILNIAQGSLSETEYHLLLSGDLEYGEVNKLQSNAEEVSKLLEAYMNAIRK
jgi:four helix bundle protein